MLTPDPKRAGAQSGIPSPQAVEAALKSEPVYNALRSLYSLDHFESTVQTLVLRQDMYFIHVDDGLDRRQDVYAQVSHLRDLITTVQTEMAVAQLRHA